MPPKTTKLVFGSRTIDLELESDREFTVLLLANGKSATIKGDLVKPANGPVAVILNATSETLAVSKPQELGTIAPISTSRPFPFAGAVEASGVSCKRADIKPDGIYAVVFELRNGKLAGRVLWTNPPMDVAGATQ
jgi:hypothetical protein